MTAEHFLHKAVEYTIASGTFGISWTDIFTHKGGITYRGRDGNKDYRRQQWVDPDHHSQRTQYRHQTGHYLRDVCCEAGAYYINIIGNPADQVSCRVPVEKANGQPQELFEYIPAHFSGDPLADEQHSCVNADSQQGGNDIDRQHFFCVNKYNGEIYLPLTRGGGVYRRAGEAGAHQGECVG